MTLTTDSKERKGIPVTTGCLHYFPLALAEVARLSKAGNDKHNPGQPLHWSRDKSNDHADCIGRHLLEVGTVDPDDGFLHDTKLAWRALANLQVALETRAASVSSKDTGLVTTWMTMHQFQEMELVESGIRIDLLRYDDSVITDVVAGGIHTPHAFRGWRFHS